MKKSNINWLDYSAEEIFLKMGEMQRTYEMMKKMMIEMDEQMQEIEIAFQEAKIALNSRGIE